MTSGIKRKVIMGLGASLVSLIAASGVYANEATSERHAAAATQYRQALFQLVRSNMAPLGGMAKGAIPFDESVMKTNAVRLEQLADMMSDYLVTDTSKFDVETSAKDEMWEDFSDVEAKIEAMRAAAQNLASVVEAGDTDGYRAAIGKVGGSCKSCHDAYKAD